MALVLAARLARHCGADLHVLYVEDPLLDAAARHVGIDLARHTERELLRFIADAWPAVLCSPQVHVVAGADVDVILEVAHRQAADLIVIAARLARHCGADLHVLYVEDPLLDAAARHVGIDLARHTERELLRFIADAWPAVLCSPQVHVVAGADVDVILEVAHRQAADLIVIDGARISGAETFFFGSRTEGLLRRADVSLLVAPAEWSPPHPDAADLADLGPVIALVDMSDTAVSRGDEGCG